MLVQAEIMEMTPVTLIRKIINDKVFVISPPPSFHFLLIFPATEELFLEMFSVPQGITSSRFLRTHPCDESHPFLSYLPFLT